MKSFLIFLICLSSVTSSHATTKISHAIEQKILETDPNINIGIKIANLDSNKIIYEKNPDRYYSFASALKFITITSLRQYFGADHKFTNIISKEKDNYYLDINDPDFGSEDLEALIASMKKKNIHTIKGNFYIVKNAFTLPALMRTKTMSDHLYCYGAPITRVHINKNCSRLVATPSKVNQKIKINASRELVPYKIINNAITIPSHKWDRIHTKISNGQYTISGTLNNASKVVVIGAVTHDNLAHVKGFVQNYLLKNNITLNGKILYAARPKKDKIIISASKELNTIASIALKKSDNFITDYLLAEYSTLHKKHEWREAAELLKKLVHAEFNVDLTKSKITEGSGISRYNLLTVNQFHNFLTAVAKKSDFKDILLLMATPNENCTLNDRLKNTSKLYVKTGSLQGVISLIGYFYDKHDKLHSLVIVLNNIYEDNNKYLKLIDEIIEMTAN